MPQIVDEARFDRFAQCFWLCLSDAAGDAFEHVVGRLLVAFRIFLEQDVQRELLRCNQLGGRCRCGAGVVSVFCHGVASNGVAGGAARWVELRRGTIPPRVGRAG